MELTSIESVDWPEASRSGAAQYLHIAVRLFIASSGPYDPISKPLSNNSSSRRSRAVDPTEVPCAADFQEVSHLVQQSNWAVNGFRGFGDYLKFVFEDSQQLLPMEPTTGLFREHPTQLDPVSVRYEDFNWPGIFNPSLTGADGLG